MSETDLQPPASDAQGSEDPRDEVRPGGGSSNWTRAYSSGSLQSVRGIGGDPLEIGVYYGKSPFLLGYCGRPGEHSMVCDVFEELGGGAEESVAEHNTYHRTCARLSSSASIGAFTPDCLRSSRSLDQPGPRPTGWALSLHAYY